jgi:subtilisin family serine protease
MGNFPTQLPHDDEEVLLDITRRLLAVHTSTDRDTVAVQLRPAELVLEDTGEVPSVRNSDAVNHTDTRFWVRSADGQVISDQREAAIRTIFGIAVDWIGPVYRQAVPAGRPARVALLCPLPHVLLVRRQAGTTTSPRAAVAAIAGDDAAVTEDEQRSELLAGYHYLVLTDPATLNAYQLRPLLLTPGTGWRAEDVQFETMPMTVPTAVYPGDPTFSLQWNLARIAAPAGWAGLTLSAAVTIGVIDGGFDLAHPQLAFHGNGPATTSVQPADHGTACAGIVAAMFNHVGPAGLFANCRILPVRVQNYTSADIAAAIDWAWMNGADVISMSLASDSWKRSVVDSAIQAAYDHGVLMCVATQNYDGPICYPATNPLVMAIGASDLSDNRKSPASSDGQDWGSNYGASISVAAPGVLIPTTDFHGAAGFNVDGSGGEWRGVIYGSLGDPAGDYLLVFGGTSAATPHVAGLAALLRSAHPGLTGPDVRDIIECTTDKTGSAPYSDIHANGTWNTQLGYGRINVLKALDQADVLIPRVHASSGRGPSGRRFWSTPSIVLHPVDGAAEPATWLLPGVAHLLWVRVRNDGPKDARNVVVATRLVPFPGTQFVHPADWNAVDELHVLPRPIRTHFAVVPAGTEVVAQFAVSPEQVEVLRSDQWFPSILAAVTADNDYGFSAAATTGTAARSNNLAQRSVSTVVVPAGGSGSFPFLAGHPSNRDTVLHLAIERSPDWPPETLLTLELDMGRRWFPDIDVDEVSAREPEEGRHRDCMLFLDRTRIRTRLGCCDGVLTLEPGSRFGCTEPEPGGEVSATGGDLAFRSTGRQVRIREHVATVTLPTAPGRYRPLVLTVRAVPGPAGPGPLEVAVAQLGPDRAVIGGVSVRFVAG